MMRMLTEHTAEEHHDEVKTGVYTWLKKKFRESKTGSSHTSMELDELMQTILCHPKMIYNKIDINMEKVLQCMKENARRDRVVMNSIKHM